MTRRFTADDLVRFALKRAEEGWATAPFKDGDGIKSVPGCHAEAPFMPQVARSPSRPPQIAPGDSAAPFAAYCHAAGLPRPLAEYRFHESRKWRFDYAWPRDMVAVEVEGGAWIGGRHTSGAGFVKDCEKYSEAAALGWRILRVQPKQLMTAATLELIRRTLAVRYHP